MRPSNTPHRPPRSKRSGAGEQAIGPEPAATKPPQATGTTRRRYPAGVIARKVTMVKISRTGSVCGKSATWQSAASATRRTATAAGNLRTSYSSSVELTVQMRTCLLILEVAAFLPRDVFNFAQTRIRHRMHILRRFEKPVSRFRRTRQSSDYGEEAVMKFVCLHCKLNAFLLTTDSAGRTVVTCVKCKVPVPFDEFTKARPPSRSGRERSELEPMRFAARSA